MKFKKHKKIIYLISALFIFYTIINGTFSIYREIIGDSISLNILSPSGMVNVSFNPNGGAIPEQDATRSVQNGTAVGALPTSVTRPNYNFDGWYTDPTDGTKITDQTIVNGSTVTYYAHWIKIVCKKAAIGTLHTETCDSSGSCINLGYSANDTITYGTIPGNKSPLAGDAYDCDVNNDEIWNPLTERFYYIRGFGGTTQTENSALVHFTSFDSAGQMDSSDSRESKNYATASTFLPTSSTWSNPSLIENNGKVTRFIKKEDLSTACGGLTDANLANCKFFLETSKFQSENLGRSGIWIEEENSSYHRIHTKSLYIYHSVQSSSENTARPVIEIPSNTIEGYQVAQSYNITFNPGQGTLDNQSDASRMVQGGTAIGALPTATRENYTLLGWFTDPTDGTQINENTIVSGNDTYYAHWVENITVTFNANGGTVTPSSKEIAPGEAIGQLPTPNYSGREFIGWYTDPDAGTIVNSITIFNTTTQIYAHWEELPLEYVFYIPGECKFTSTGITNGDNGNCISIVNPTGSNIDYTQPSLSAKKYIDSGISLYDTTNHDKDYEIHFEIVSYNSNENESQATFFNTKKEGGNFPGLVVRRTTDNSGNIEFASRKTSKTNESIMISSSDITKMSVYRIGEEIYYSINDGEKIFANNLTEYNPIFDLKTWFGGAPTNESATTARRFLNGTLKNIYIKLRPDSITKATITFDPNYQDAQTFDEEYTLNQEIGTLPTITRTGYTFLGWFTDPTNGTQITSSTIVNDDDIYYAHWHENITITLHANDGYGVPNTITVPYNTAIGTLPTPERTGYVFGGWYTDDVTYQNEVTETSVFNATTEIYARWLENITITFNANDGTVTPSSKTFLSGSEIGELPIPERTGYSFGGWYTDDETYQNEVTETSVFNVTTEIYARWLENITITFNANDGTVIPSSKTFPAGTEIGELPIPEKEGFDFAGWYTDDGTYQNVVTESTVFNTTTVIYAKWNDQNDVTITFNADGGTVSTSSITFSNGSAIGELPIPEKPGYLFVGWFTDNTWATEVTEETTFNLSTSIIAKWVDEKYVACIGDACYTTLQNAVAGVPTTGEKTTIKIIKDITVTANTKIPNTKWVELNIGSHTIDTSTGSFTLLVNEGKLDIINGTLISTAGYIFTNSANAILNISGGQMIYNKESDTEKKVLEMAGGIVNITGGELLCNSKAAVINANGGTLNVSGGRIIGRNTTKGQAIYNNGGTTTISGTAYLENNSQSGSTNGRAALTNNSGTVNILGGTIISQNNAAVSNKGTLVIGINDGTINITSPSLQGNTYGLENTSGTVTVYDGIFKGKTSTNGKAISNETTVNHGTLEIVHDTETIEGTQYTTAYLKNNVINITINFNKNGGSTVEYIVKSFDTEGPINSLPSATKTNAEFLGWFTSETGGERVLTSRVITESDDGTTYYAHYTNATTVCRPATSLHTNGNTSFGQIHTGLTLSPGDAYDCDVNGDGTFDATNERFYYLTDTSSGKAVFIFSNNIHGSTPMCKPDAVAYGTFSDGPNTAIEELPTTAEWTNVNLYTEPRNITNETGSTVVNNYIYTGKAARFATLEEIKAATTSSINGTSNELSSYTFLLENTVAYGDCRSNYWIETQKSNNNGAYRIDGNSKMLGNSTNSSGVRPVIEVPYSSIVGVENIVEFDTIPQAMRVYFNNVSNWNYGQNDSNYSSFNSAMTNNLDNHNCVYYQNDNTGTEYGSEYCDQPNKYDTGVTGNINVYEYNESTGVISNTQANYVFNDNGKLYNFIPGKVYYWESATDANKHGYVRPTGERRLISIPGTNRQTRNIRDLGGLPVDTDGDGTIDGKIKYQKLYRGEKIWGTNRNGVTKAQFEKLGIYNELDLRTQGSEIVASEEDQLTNYIPNEIIHYEIDHTEFGTAATEPRFNGKSYYQLSRDAAIDVMKKIVAGDDDYAIYFHCRIGADRTGTLAYILEGLLGVPTEYRHQDYELTTFFGLRERTRYYYNKGSNNHKFLYLKKSIRHATPGNNEITGEENVMDWFLLEGNSTPECDDITGLINQFRNKMIDYN